MPYGGLPPIYEDGKFGITFEQRHVGGVVVRFLKSGPNLFQFKELARLYAFCELFDMHSSISVTLGNERFLGVSIR